MPAIKNRELSQFASLLQVNDVGKDIVIAPDTNSYIGIGSDVPANKLDVIVTATDFNVVSDIQLKTNIQTIENSMELIENLRGVTFDWKDTNKSTMGVIAQEIQEIFPNLVNQNDIMSVNYNGLIGVLIEAVKEMSIEIKKLKSTINLQ